VSAAAPNVDIFLDGKECPDGDFVSYVVDHEIGKPSFALVELSNQNDIYSPSLKVGGTVEVKVGNSSTTVFKGHAIGYEGKFEGGKPTKLVIRAVDAMHKLSTKKASRTFTKKTDQAILSTVVGDAGLSLEYKHKKSITYDHVYQHNLSNLQFVLVRAGRMGCHVWCEDKKLFVKEPDLGQKSGVQLSVDKDGNLRKFQPRISNASVVKKVSVKGWNPETKELITGEAQAQSSPLGKENAVAACGDLGKEESFTVDHPIWSKEEADAIAEARLREMNLGFITGTAELAGEHKLKLGTTVEIQANASGSSDPFNGGYYVAGITHRHTMPKSKEGGFVSVIRFMRDAWKG
jgi:hypothetical protein